MDYRHLLEEEVARESLIAISNGVGEEIVYLPESENGNGVEDATVIHNAKIKTIEDELIRSELISIAAFESSAADNNSDES
ncbi:hypothetical protein Lser_V15G30455 [Lactuca serriola]